VSGIGRPDPDRQPYLGYRGDDGDTPFGRYFDPAMAPLRGHVVEALQLGPQSPELVGGLESVPSLIDDGYQPVETGFALGPDGSARVSVLTPMPGVSPAMWDWWFGWHGCDPRRYKLWHPRAHLWAGWNDGADGDRRGRDRYVGRTSFVDEYLGSMLAQAAIQFVRPSVVGLDEAELADDRLQTAVCARLGSSKFPVDIGWLVHQVRRTGDGSEMRSRFWMGGPHIRVRSTTPGVPKEVPAAVAKVLRPTARSATDLLVHCAQEMAHLASFLPELHGEFGGS